MYKTYSDITKGNLDIERCKETIKSSYFKEDSIFRNNCLSYFPRELDSAFKNDSCPHVRKKYLARYEEEIKDFLKDSHWIVREYIARVIPQEDLMGYLLNEAEYEVLREGAYRISEVVELEALVKHLDRLIAEIPKENLDMNLSYLRMELYSRAKGLL